MPDYKKESGFLLIENHATMAWFSINNKAGYRVTDILFLIYNKKNCSRDELNEL